MRTIAAIAAVTLGTALGAASWSGSALSQANLRPDPTPRVPSQPGQAPALEDQLFLREAAAASQGQIDLGALVEGKTQDDALRTLAREIAQTHRTALDGLKRLAQARHVDPAQPSGPSSDQRADAAGAAGVVSNPRNLHGGLAKEAMGALGPLSGDDLARRYVQEQLRIHDRLADLYQTESSHTPDRELASFAITTLVPIQKNRDALRQMAARFGIDTGATGQAVQYGDPAKAR